MSVKRNLWLAGAAGTGMLLWLARRHFRPADLEAGPNAPQVVVLGAGFAGLAAVHTLEQRLQGRALLLLIDRHNYHLFTPMLYQVAAWGLNPYNVAFPIRDLTGPRQVTFRRAVVTGIDLERQRIQVEDDEDEISYDYLIIALGTVTNFFDIEGVREHTLSLKWLEEGVAIRNQVIDRLEEATEAEDDQEQRALLTFVVVGGGATGVETAATLSDLIQRVLPLNYPDLEPELARVLLIEMKPELLPGMAEAMGAIAREQLEKVGVELWLETTVTDVTATQVTVEDGRTVATRTIIWAAGVRAPDVVAELDAPHGKGGSVAVDEYLQVRGRPGVYAVGDNASIEDPASGEAVPLLAQAAEQAGKAAAENVVRTICGRPLKPFRYRSRGNTIALGKTSGILQVGDSVINGLPGWLAWRLIHLAKIRSFRNKAVTVLEWAVGYLHNQNVIRFELRPTTAVDETTEAVLSD